MKVGIRTLSWNVRHAVLVLREAFYRFDQLKSQKKAPAAALQHVIFPFTAKKELQQTLAEAAALGLRIAVEPLPERNARP